MLADGKALCYTIDNHSCYNKKVFDTLQRNDYKKLLKIDKRRK